METLDLVQIDAQLIVNEGIPGCSIIYAPTGQAWFSNRPWAFHAEPQIQEQQGMNMRNVCSRVPVITTDNERVFPCSHSDFFHAKADQCRDEAWEIIRQCPNEVFFLLTKRPPRILSHLPMD